jgi:hypothetical protein
MRSGWLTSLMIILVFVAPIWSGTIEIIEFDPASLDVNAAKQSVTYGTLESIADAGYPSVNFRRLQLSSYGRAQNIEITSTVIFADTIDPGFQPRLNSPDMITSDFDYSVTQPMVLKGGNGLYPTRPIQLHRQQLGDNTIWSVLIFPFQYLDDGRIVFNRRIELIFGGDDEGLIRIGRNDEPWIDKRKPASFKSVIVSVENGCPLGHQYIVVTSPELSEAFKEFIDFKIKTGYDAGLAITDSIYTYYSGIDQAEAVRNYLRDVYAAGGAYVLLGGNGEHVPLRYAFYYNTEEIIEPDQLLICDLYFADYDGDWDADGDGVWGEPTADCPDAGPEVMLGRLPFSESEQVLAYLRKLKTYLFDPGGGDRNYLRRAVFFTSDQMLDFFGDHGQQHFVADYIPDYMDVDCDQLAESPTGDAPTPSGPFSPEAVSSLDNGYGLINIIAHGRPDGFILNSHEYNLFPKYYLLTGEEHIGYGAFDDLGASQKIGLYYSIACSQAAIDLEPVFNMSVPSVVEKLLEIDSAGAVGMIAFSRWGWVGSSYRIMASFYEHLFDDAGGYPVEAMYRTYFDYPYYTDQIYGQNFYGDPSLSVYQGIPSELELMVPDYYNPVDPISCRVMIDGEALIGQPVMVRIGSDQYLSVSTDSEGQIDFLLPDDCSETIEITAFMPGVIAASSFIYPSIAADADDEDLPLPEKFELRQNYPNPFNPSTTISFSLSRHQEVSLNIYDILGRLIDKPVNGFLAAGTHQVQWDGTDSEGNDVASGIYFYRLISPEGTAIKKMALVK